MAADITESPVHWIEGATKSPHRSPKVLPPVAVTGAHGGNAALISLLAGLEDLGLIDNNST